ncbi:MAG: hypothetical protein WCQ69_08965 [Bacteroidales bacterium]|jgi:hypothetical protein
MADDYGIPVPPRTQLETVLAGLGLNDPGIRFAAVAIAATTILFAVRPGYIFLDDGTPNPESVIPWWLPGLTLGAIAALYV